MKMMIPMGIGLLVALISIICIKVFDDKIRSNFKLKFLVTWSTVVGLLTWLVGFVYVIVKLQM